MLALATAIAQDRGCDAIDRGRRDIPRTVRNSWGISPPLALLAPEVVVRVPLEDAFEVMIRLKSMRAQGQGRNAIGSDDIPRTGAVSGTVRGKRQATRGGAIGDLAGFVGKGDIDVRAGAGEEVKEDYDGGELESEGDDDDAAPWPGSLPAALEHGHAGWRASWGPGPGC